MRVLLRFSLVAASVWCAVLAVEALCRGYLLFFPRPHEPSREERAETPPPPYKDTDYYSAEFLRELDTSPDVIIQPGAEYAVPADVSGRFINASGGMRATTDQPRDPSRRVVVFGGSTIYSHEVPDRYTIPSFIQRAVNASCPETTAVFNYGVPSMTATQQVARLKTVAFHNADIVVFFDGFNDVLGIVLAGTRGADPESADPAPAIGYRAAWGRWIHATAARWRHASALAEVVARAGDRTAVETVGDAKALRDNLPVARAVYRRTLLAAQQQVDAAGARFFHFLQPHLFATALTTTYRQMLADDPLHTVERGFQAAYSVLEEAIAEAGTQGVRSVNLSRIFDRDALPDEVFLDFIHVNHKGNEIIAAAIFEEIAPALACRPYTSPRD